MTLWVFPVEFLFLLGPAASILSCHLYNLGNAHLEGQLSVPSAFLHLPGPVGTGFSILSSWDLTPRRLVKTLGQSLWGGICTCGLCSSSCWQSGWHLSVLVLVAPQPIQQAFWKGTIVVIRLPRRPTSSRQRIQDCNCNIRLLFSWGSHGAGSNLFLICVYTFSLSSREGT